MINGTTLILKELIIHFVDGYVHRSPSYGVYISQLFCLARVRSHVDDFNKRNTFLTYLLMRW